MAHTQQVEYCLRIKEALPNLFKDRKVLDIGAFNVNGNEQYLFDGCDVDGLDLGPGPGIDIVCPAQDYDAPDETYGTIISCECWEHNPYYKESIQNAVRMLESGGLFIFTCATTGREEHGTLRQEDWKKAAYEDWKTMPNVSRVNWDNDYYRNVTEEDIRDAIDVDDLFIAYRFEVNEEHHDLYFWGIKK